MPADPWREVMSSCERWLTQSPPRTAAQMLGQAAAALRGAEPRPVAFHPTCHLEIVEEAGYGHLQDLKATLVGHRDDLIGLPDLEALGPPLGAVLLELPQRELGGLVGAVLAGPARRT